MLFRQSCKYTKTQMWNKKILFFHLLNPRSCGLQVHLIYTKSFPTMIAILYWLRGLVSVLCRCGALALCQNESWRIHSDEGPTPETSVLESLYGSQFSFKSSLFITKHSSTLLNFRILPRPLKTIYFSTSEVKQGREEGRWRGRVG